MVTLLLLLALAWQFYLGYHRGFIQQVYLTLALLIALVVASQHYAPLATAFTLWVPYAQASEETHLPYFSTVNVFDMDKVFYAGLAFVLLVLLVYGLLKLCGIFLAFLPAVKPVCKKPYIIGSGLLSLLNTLVFWSLVLNLLTTIPFAQIQTLLSQHLLLKGIIQFPILSQLIQQLWVTRLLG